MPSRTAGRAVAAALVSLTVLASGLAHAQTPLGNPPALRDGGFFERRWDILLIEQGRVILGYGDGKLFGFDVRSAMGNPAALSPETQIKWNQALSELNHNVLLVATRYPPDLYPQGAALSEDQFSDDLGGLFEGFREEEYIDLAAWLIRSGYMAGSSEEDAMRAFRTIGYLGGATAVVNMLLTNQVDIPVTVRLYRGEYRNKPYNIRLKMQMNRFGFGDVGRTRWRSRLTLRRPDVGDFSLDFRSNGILTGNPTYYREQVIFNLKRLGTYFVQAEQPYDALTASRGFRWSFGAAIDFISPSRFEDSRVRTGFQFNFDRTARVPENYFVEFYERYRLKGGKRDIVMQGRGELIVDGIRYEGLAGEIRANFLLGSTAPRASRTYTAHDWDRFSRIYVSARVDAREKGKDEYLLFVAYAAPFDIDIAFEKGFDWWLRRRTGG